MVRKKLYSKNKNKKKPSRLEMEVCGHGLGYRTWSIEYRVFKGEIEDPLTGAWEKLVEYWRENQMSYLASDGTKFPIMMVLMLLMFGFPETEVGLTITTAGTKLLSQIVGLGKAKELVFTGEFVDAHEALRIGLANKVVAADKLLDEALAMARKIAEKSPLALKLSRIAIDQGLHSSFEQTLEMEAGHLLTCAGAQNHKDFDMALEDAVEKSIDSSTGVNIKV